MSTAVAAMLRSFSATSGLGCHLCGLLPANVGAVTRNSAPSVLLASDRGRLVRCRDRDACARRQEAVRAAA